MSKNQSLVWPVLLVLLAIPATAKVMMWLVAGAVTYGVLLVPAAIIVVVVAYILKFLR